MKFKRIIRERIKSKIHKGKAIVVTGSRQVGKTTLIENILKKEDYLFLNGDDSNTRQALEIVSLQEIKK